MRVLGLDVATTCGWALVDNATGKERSLGRGVITLARAPSDEIEKLVDYALSAPAHKPDLVVVELPYLDKNPATLLCLAMLAGRFQQAFEVAGFPVELLRATQWQRTVLGGFGGKKRDGLKKAAVLWARATFGVPMTGDEADAHGIAACVLRAKTYQGKCKTSPRAETTAGTKKGLGHGTLRPDR